MYFHLVFMTKGWLYKMANYYCFQTKLGEEERETAELDCPWPMTDNSAVTYVLVIWVAAESISEMRHPIQVKLNLVYGFFFPSWKEIWLGKGEGRRQEYKANSQENSKHISMDRIDLPAGKSKFGWGSSRSQSLDAGFKHSHFLHRVAEHR